MEGPDLNPDHQKKIPQYLNLLYKIACVLVNQFAEFFQG